MIIAATGHRPNKLGGYGQDVYDLLVHTATKALDGMATKTISGMALGWDMAIAEASIALDIPFIAAVPFKGQESKWPPPSKAKYFKILKQAAEIVYVSDDGYAPAKMQIRNEWMVDNADVVLTLWDGTTGGTNNCVLYAKTKKKKIINVWPYWEKLNALHETR